MTRERAHTACFSGRDERDGPDCGGSETGVWGGSDGLGGRDSVDDEE